MVQAICLGSSSNGNCFVLTFKNNNYTRSIMVECGFSLKEIMLRMIGYGLTLNDIECCLVTHGHQDHCKGMQELEKRQIPIFATKTTLGCTKTHYHDILLEKDICVAPGIFIYAFGVEHDIEESVGFIIYCSETNERVLFINDCKYTKADLSQFEFDYVFIECNHTAKIVYTLYNKAVKEQDVAMIKRYNRLINAHMSERGTIKTLEKLNLKNCKAIFLMHLSDGHANEYQMKNEINELFKIPTFVCQKNMGIK